MTVRSQVPLNGQRWFYKILGGFAVMLVWSAMPAAA
jgi:hypothetical protein